jgi:hypothetical protein
VQHTYRFNAEMWAEFEADCNLNLRNVRVVIEALVRYWLDAGPETREVIARHERRPAASETLQRLGQPSSASFDARLRHSGADSIDDADLLDV